MKERLQSARRFPMRRAKREEWRGLITGGVIFGSILGFLWVSGRLEGLMNRVMWMLGVR